MVPSANPTPIHGRSGIWLNSSRMEGWMSATYDLLVFMLDREWS